MHPSFDLALQASGKAYLDLELDLRRSSQLDAPLTEWLKKQQQAHVDPLARLLATVVIKWTGPAAEDYKKALEYLEFLPVRLARTAVGVPDGQGAESYLTLHFGGRLTELMALRLLKEPDWPHWKRCAAIFYLQQHKLPATTFALIRVAIETATDEQRELAVDAIRESADPELSAKLGFEIARARKLGRRIPADIAALGG